MGIGKERLPAEILQSAVLSESHLAQLASLPELPLIDPSFEDEHLKNIIYYYSLNPQDMEKETHLYAASLLDKGNVYDAWQVLLLSGDML
ncbi:MAG TPA: hypothetical protein VM935_12595 [Chitinophagaceae bacterium]|nr:hypothetical protein [Chitinophagaceae bacterium]